MIIVYVPSDVSITEIVEHAHLTTERVYSAISALVTYTDDSEHARATEIHRILTWLRD